MPRRSLRRCSWPPGCNARVAGGRCPKHREPNRPTARQRGYDSGWDALARRVIEEEPICRRCGIAPSTVAGHILSRRRGGKNVRSNLRGICASCNALEREADRKGETG